jgi:hypothetical protein
MQEGQAGEELLKPLDPEEVKVERLLLKGLPRAKSRWQPPLFPLLPQGAFELAENILTRWQNPYLPFARDALELRLSRTLWERRPDLAPEVLSRVHFATLLAWELLQADPAAGESGDRHGLRLLLMADMAQAHTEQEK